MSIFPTKILLATDGSEEATLAARTAVDLAQKTSSELQLVHARPLPALTAYAAAETPTTGEIDQEEAIVKGEQGPLEPGEEYRARAWVLRSLDRPEHGNHGVFPPRHNPGGGQ